ncbi:MAG: ankyrin repeat domain-containing protein [Rickettsiaceae bacterium]
MINKKQLLIIQSQLKHNKARLELLLEAAMINNDIKALNLIFNELSLLDILDVNEQQLFDLIGYLFRTDKYLSSTTWLIKKLTPAQRKVFFHTSANVTPLHQAALYGAAKTVQMLIKYKFNTNALNVHKETPLHKAVLGGSSDTIKCILEEKNTDINIQNLDKLPALFHVVRHSNKDNQQAIEQLFPRKHKVQKHKLYHNADPMHYYKFKQDCNQGVIRPEPWEAPPKRQIDEVQNSINTATLMICKASILAMQNNIKAARGQINCAESYYKKALKIIKKTNDPEDLANQPIALKGLILIHTYRYTLHENLPQIRKLMEQLPDSILSNIYNALCRYFLHSGDYDQAEEFGEMALKLDKQINPNYTALALFSLAKAKLNNCKLKEAEDLLNSMEPNVDPDYVLSYWDMLYVISHIYAEIGRDFSPILNTIKDKEAQFLYAQVNKYNLSTKINLPTDFDSGNFLSQLNDTNNKSLVCNVLALDCLQKGEFAIARQHLRQFISLEKVTVDTIKNLLSTYLIEQNYAEGYKELQNLQSIYPFVFQNHLCAPLIYIEYTLTKYSNALDDDKNILLNKLSKITAPGWAPLIDDIYLGMATDEFTEKNY